ncbi:MAG: hypothetical protein AAB575_03085 [Patescibacteria group bacterium]
MKLITSFDELYNLDMGAIVLGRKKGSLSDSQVLMPDEGIAVVHVHNERFTKSSLIGSIHSSVHEGERAVEIDLPIHGVHTLRVVTAREFKMYDRDLFVLDEVEYSQWINENSKHQDDKGTS